MLKSTRDRLERQEKTQKQVDFFEQQKENLKDVKCGSVEEIAEKLNMLHSYEDQIKAAKAAYNSEQMWHILDESTERGEKIAEAAEKTEPKTPEERQEELVEEALGIEGPDGVLEELMDEVEELTEEMTGELAEAAAGEMAEEMAGEPIDEAAGELTEKAAGTEAELSETAPGEEAQISVQAAAAGAVQEEIPEAQADVLEMWKKGYHPFDVRL